VIAKAGDGDRFAGDLRKGDRFHMLEPQPKPLLYGVAGLSIAIALRGFGLYDGWGLEFRNLTVGPVGFRAYCYIAGRFLLLIHRLITNCTINWMLGVQSIKEVYIYKSSRLK